MTALTVLLAARAEAVTLTRGPYLQLLTTQSVTVVWNTDVPAACGLVLQPADGEATTLAGAAGTVCALTATGLTPGKPYAYVPLADGVPLDAASEFRTDDPTAPFSFLVFGDSGTGSSDQLAVRDRMLATPADFILHTGDMVYSDGLAADFDPKFFTPYQALLRHLVLWPCLGNHDVRTAGGGPWQDAFYTPANNAAGSEHYYSFDFGNAHVAVLDSNASVAPGSAQYRFLADDLAASRATWKFVAFHHTVYSSGEHGSALTLRASLVPLFDAQRVDVVFMGHDHDYERTQPLRADQIVPPGEGTVYVTTGGGGGEARPVGPPLPVTAYLEPGYHFVKVAIDGGTLRLQMIREDGVVRDTWTLTKDVAPPEPTCGDGIVDQLDEECDGADDQRCPGRCGSACRCPSAGLSLELEPVADTFIEAGTAATWDHGAASRLDVDQQPASLTYLKFDLSGLAAPVASARLVLACSNGTSDGGTVYPLADSTWVEGTASGADSRSAQGAGLKWVDVDTNRDGAVDEADVSPWVPDWSRPLGELGAVPLGQLVSVDVSDAFRAGPGLYSFVIRNANTNGASYGSRERTASDERPRLLLTLASACVANGCDDHEPCTDDRCDPGVGCVFTPRTGACDDGNACTSADACVDGVCRGGVLADCDDGNPCTVDACDPAVGCVSLAGNAGALCRPAVGPCDREERCSGASADCPPDGRRASGTACPDDGNPCTRDRCDGTSTLCKHPPGNAGAVCRPAAGECDRAETCLGTSIFCPGDLPAPAGTSCADDGDVCTDDACDGAGVCVHLPDAARCVDGAP